MSAFIIKNRNKNIILNRLLTKSKLYFSTKADFEFISSNKDIGLLTIKNSSKRNALSENVLKELHSQLENISIMKQNKKIPRIVILASEGQVFSSGHDLKELNSMDNKKRTEIFELCSKVMLKIAQSESIFIAEVQGLATAAGCQLAATCDLVVASNHAKFATPGVKIGLFCTTPSVALGRVINQKRAMQMLLTGEEINANTAKEWGLINEIVNVDGDKDNNKLREHTLKLADKINQFSGETLSYGKRAFYQQINYNSVQEAYNYASACMVTNFGFEDTKEGVAAFIEKRKPNFNKKI
jgi:enoyl-CoA hydratase/carnithine racemase